MQSDSKLDSLRADLQGQDAARRLAAADFLLRHPGLARNLAPELLQLFGTPDDAFREVCVGAVEKIEWFEGEIAKRVAAFLTGDELQAVWAAKLLGRLGGDAAFAVDALATLLAKSDSTAAREEAAWALGRIGADAKRTLPVLEAAAKVDSPRLSRYAKEAIGKISGA